MKDYFEMGEAERNLHMISNSLNCFAVMMSEGIAGDYTGLTISEVIKLQASVCDHLLNALKDVDTLLKAVQEGE